MKAEIDRSDMMDSPKKIILASNSPRRRELLAGLGLEFVVDCGNSFEEVMEENTPPRELPLMMSKGKSHGFHRELEDNEILITADTVVVLGEKALGKPHDAQEAREMLSALSGRAHEVITAVTIRCKERETSFSDSTTVHFKELTANEIDYYVRNYAPFDKAGAYGIQEWIGYIGISSIEGSYFNVMGFPVHRVYAELQSFL